MITTAGGALELRALRARLHTSKANATEVVSTLEARGLVARTRMAHDRRAAMVSLTALGREVVDRLFPEHTERVSDAFAVLDEAEKRSLAEICRKLGRGVGSATGQPPVQSDGPMAVDPDQSFPDLEQQVLQRWRERDVFAESLRRREGAPEWVFYEGPPTANGKPGAHHVLARVFKDIYPRYRTMRGDLVQRKGGWDCHGLPVEIAVERELGIGSKEEIEAYGIAEFNARCRESVFAFVDDWNTLTERIGFWIDLDDAYRTLDATFVESVWWALRQIHDKGLLYEGHRVVPYCTRCGTSLSSHELGQPGVYQEVSDPSVYVRFAVTEDHGPLDAGDELLVWTTTPWTLPSNAAVAVDPELRYVRARAAGQEHPVVLAENLIERVLARRPPRRSRSSRSSRAQSSKGPATQPPFDFLPGELWGELGHSVLVADFVTDTEGTGLVHTAIAFGEDDFRLGERYGLAVVNPVRGDGTYDDRMGPYAGRYVKDADADLIDGPAPPRPAAARRGLPALLSALLALRHAAHLLRQAVVVHRDVEDLRPAAGRKRRDRLASRPHQGGPLRRLAAQQRRLGAVARALLGHAAAGVALRPGPHPRHRLVRRARAAQRNARRRPSPPVRR